MSFESHYLETPTTILNARDGDWQERKRRWLALGIKSEVGRDVTIVPGGGLHRSKEHDGCFRRGYQGQDAESGASVFDPVLCELAYRWFCPPGGQVVDPFAGGSVRGVVAGVLGRQYWGCDLRAEQIAANNAQQALCAGQAVHWVTGNALELLPQAPLADFIFSCPPYGNLEKYSDDPRDLSAMSPEKFLEGYQQIIALAGSRLREHRFACFVVGDYRISFGYYANFVSQTVEAFQQAGLALYNEAILVTMIGSLPLRISRQFQSGRKLGKTHQNVLVFVKGDWERAAQACRVTIEVER